VDATCTALSALPPTTSGGWLVPSETNPTQTYFVVQDKDNCSCSMHCSHCNCCPHMYNCSCVDFAVHATVCKHVHTIHSLRAGNALSDEVTLVEDSVTTEMAAIEHTSVEVDLVQSEVTVRKNMETMRNRCISKCHQIIALLNNCDDVQTLTQTLPHLNTAAATLNAVTSTAHKLPIIRKIASDKKLATQRRFFSTKAKRGRPVQKRLLKPSQMAVTAIKREMLPRQNYQSACS
jgi:hypothetical protein